MCKKGQNEEGVAENFAKILDKTRVLTDCEKKDRISDPDPQTFLRSRSDYDHDHDLILIPITHWGRFVEFFVFIFTGELFLVY